MPELSSVKILPPRCRGLLYSVWNFPHTLPSLKCFCSIFSSSYAILKVIPDFFFFFFNKKLASLMKSGIFFRNSDSRVYHVFPQNIWALPSLFLSSNYLYLALFFLLYHPVQLHCRLVPYVIFLLFLIYLQLLLEKWEITFVILHLPIYSTFDGSNNLSCLNNRHRTKDTQACC